jgi:hypothetical protein
VIASVVTIAGGVFLGITNPVERLLTTVLATPRYFLLVLLLSAPCMWLYLWFAGLCRWLIKLVHWLID